jgi:hypothetical protein
MTRVREHHRWGPVLVLLAAAGCGGAAPDLAPPCGGVEAHGICWQGMDGITVSRERVERVFSAARTLWAVPRGELPGWRVEFRRAPPVVGGESFNGYCWGEARLIVVAPFASDCFERSAIFHELGHAWGFDDDDPRMSGEWGSIHEAMVESHWPGCEFEGSD